MEEVSDCLRRLKIIFSMDLASGQLRPKIIGRRSLRPDSRRRDRRSGGVEIEKPWIGVPGHDRRDGQGTRSLQRSWPGWSPTGFRSAQGWLLCRSGSASGTAPPSGWAGSRRFVLIRSGEDYAALVSEEDRWLPVVAGQLPLPISEPVALGSPAAGFAWPWSVYRWIEESRVPGLRR